MTNKDLLTHFRHRISKEKLIRPKGFFFDKKYFDFVSNVNYERHHTIGRAFSDYWLVLISSEKHNAIRGVKYPYNADVFVNTLLRAWCNLINYAVDKKAIRSTVKYFKQDYFKVETWLNLIEKIKKVK